MSEDKRIINDYEIIQSFYVGKREVVVAENQKAQYKYICGYYESNEIFERIDNCFASNDYLDIMTLFCERAKEQVELCKENEHSDLGILSSDMYFRISNDDDLTGKIVVRNPDNLRREYRNAENQLFYVTGGNGAKPNSIGTKVYGYGFSDKKHCFIRRYDIVGIADSEKLPEWAKKDLADIKKQINRERKEVR